MENQNDAVAATSSAAEAPEVATTTTAPTLPKEVVLFDGTKAVIQNFQGKAFVDAQTQYQQQGITDAFEIMAFLVAQFAKKVTEEGMSPMTLEMVLDTDLLDMAPLSDWMQASIVDSKLPSGRSVKIRRGSWRDTVTAGKRYGEANRPYAMILLTTEIDGKPLDLVDVQTMDGLDFVAINNFHNSHPS